MHVTKGEKDKNINIMISGERLEVVDKFEYLGTIVTENGTIDREIQKASNVYYQMNNTFVGKKEVRTNTKLRIYKTIYTQTLTYGVEIRDKLKSKITAAEIKFLRKIVRKQELIELETKLYIRDDIEQIPLVTEIEHKQLSWYRNLVRMLEERIPRRAIDMGLVGKRRIGRPRIKWLNGVEEIVRKIGGNVQEVKKMARNRLSFRRWIEDPDAVIVISRGNDKEEGEVFY
ncbi:uncharacterized protein [Onthophagus taurus]|uniref:uncharacterized protein n=1 Tax=Onthophagus taurus TaxID=166361 RepID=UPI0039BDBB14